MSDYKAAAFILACLMAFLWSTEKDAGRSTWQACRLAMIGCGCVLFGAFAYVGFVMFRGWVTSELWGGWSEFGSYLFAWGAAVLSFWVSGRVWG